MRYVILFLTNENLCIFQKKDYDASKQKTAFRLVSDTLQGCLHSIDLNFSTPCFHRHWYCNTLYTEIQVDNFKLSTSGDYLLFVCFK